MDTKTFFMVRPPEAVPAPGPAMPKVLHRLADLETRYYQRIEAPLDDSNEFFGADSQQLVNFTLEVPVFDLLMIQRALAALLPEWGVVRLACYNGGYAVVIKRLAVEVRPGVHDFVVRDGRQFWEGPDGGRFTLDIYTDEDAKSSDAYATFTMPARDHARFVALIPKMRAWADANHFLRGQAINAQAKFLKLDGAPRLDEIILPEAVRQAIKANCVDLLRYSDLYRANGLPLRRGIVLHGPPGTGKTMIGKALARECGVSFILATPGMITEPQDVRRLFLWARRFAPSILFFEDFDMVARSRHSHGNSGVLGEFLAGLDGVETPAGIITIATTNDLAAIEPALKDRPNRFDCVLELPALTDALRREFVGRWRAGRGSLADAVDVERIVGKTNGFTGALLGELCRLAVLEAVGRRIASGNTAVEAVPVTDADVDAALARMGKRGRRPVGFNAPDWD